MTDEPTPEFEGEEPPDPDFGPGWDAVDDEPEPEPDAPQPTPAEPADRFRGIAEYDHEERLLGQLFLAGADGHDVSGRVVAKVRATGLAREHFEKPITSGTVYAAALALVDAGEPCEQLLVRDELQRRGDLERAGGEMRLRELAAAATAYANVAFHAEAIVDSWRRRDRLSALTAAVEAERNGGLEARPELRERLRIVIDDTARERRRTAVVDGATFVFETTSRPFCLWGKGDAVAWAEGEGMMLVGPQGVGKTTLGQRLALARTGICGHVLGMDVEPSELPVLYVAADRPRQIARSMRRMVNEENRAALAERLSVHAGPLPFLLTDGADLLASFVSQRGCGTVILDSLKDVALELSSDETGGRVNLAIQTALAAGIEVLALHHQRKATGDNKRPDSLADVYGSTWLTSGIGSVILLWGEPGAELVELRHLKQPAEPLGPLRIRHDHQRGLPTLIDQPDLLTELRRRGADGLTVKQTATLLHGSPDEDRYLESARRALKKLERNGDATTLPDPAGGAGRHVATGGLQEQLEGTS